MKDAERNNEPFDAVLRHAIAQIPEAATPECPDPAVLAAYYDRSLAETERDRLDAHFADCTRCQAQLAAVARADERASGARPALGIVTWMRGWRIAIPALATAAVALIVVARVMRPGIDESHRPQLVALAKPELLSLPAPAYAPQSAPSVASAPASAAPPAPAASINQLAMNKARQTEPTWLHHMEAPRAKARAEVAHAPTAVPMADLAMEQTSVSNEHVSSRATTSGVKSAIPGAVVTTAPALAPPPLAATVPAAPPPANLESAEVSSHSGTTSAPAGSAAGAAGMVAAPSRGAALGGASANTGWVPGLTVLASISPQDRSATWMAGRGGMILMRDAQGGIHPQRSGVSVDLVGGSAPSASVCWIVGNAGTVLRTIDGEHWQKVAPPTTADLTAVAADSADHAIVTAVDGRNFETSDGGASWHRQ